MSYLIRTGNGRNNISWSTTANTITRYLRRTSTGRNNITWTTIPQGSTYNILQRNGTGRNNILWSNLRIAGPTDPVTQSNISGNFVTQDPVGSSTVTIFNIRYGRTDHRILYLYRGRTYGTTITNVTMHIGSATVLADNEIYWSPLAQVPNNIISLWNRLYLYENDNNYMIFSVSNINRVSAKLSTKNFEFSTIKYNGQIEQYWNSLISHWNSDNTPLTVVFYHW